MMNTTLAESGYELNKQTGIWQRPDYCGIDYSDGEQVEHRLGEIISQAHDISVLSPELAPHCTDWASLYHLSSLRANILRPFESLFSGDVLEVGAGCGAISRYLGECGGKILSLEGSPRRAAIARARTRDLGNVAVVADNFDAFRCKHKFDVVVLIGVFEYASMFMSGDQPAAEMLAHARSFLKPSGKLIIAIENQLGLKYFAGAPEDHISVPMYGIEGRYKPNQPQTYGRQMLSGMLTDSGFRNVEFLAPYPDYKLSVSVVSEWGFSDAVFDAAALAWQSVWHDVQLPDILAFSPILVWPTIIRNGLGLDLANSFLVLASNENEPYIPRSHLAWHFSASRKPQFCKTTQFAKSASGEVEVRYTPLHTKPMHSDMQAALTQKLPSQADYVKGQCLSWQLLQILSREGWKVEEVVSFVEFYLSCLKRVSLVHGLDLKTESADSLVPGFLFDCIPQNLVATDGEVIFIDQEWFFDGSLELGHLLTRALFPAFHGAALCDLGADSFDGSRLDLFLAVTRKIGWSVSADTVYKYAELEIQILSEVIPKPTSLENYLAWIHGPLKIRLNPSQMLARRDSTISNLTQLISEKDKNIEDRDCQISNLTQLISEKDKNIEDRDCQISNLTQLISDKDHVIVERVQSITELSQLLEEQKAKEAQQCMSFEQTLAQSNQRISELAQQVAAREGQISQILSSRSWRMTAPLRNVLGLLRSTRGILRLIKHEILHAGIRKTAVKLLFLARRDGLVSVYRRAAAIGISGPRAPAPSSPESGDANSGSLTFAPYYIDPGLDSKEPSLALKYSLAVHLHLSRPDFLVDVCKRLANIGQPFDLYVSASRGVNCFKTKRNLRKLIPNARRLLVKRVPDRGQDIGPLIIQFGKHLARYEIIGHFHTNSGMLHPDLGIGFTDTLDLLLGKSGARGAHIEHILEKLSTTAKIVYPEASGAILRDRSGWGETREAAQTILQLYTTRSIDEFPEVEFPETGMFWARGACLHTMLRLPLKYQDFPQDPTPADGTLAHALRRLILIFAASHQGQNLRVHRSDSIADYRFYEPQVDFSDSIIHRDIKVLSFYLPQFHPIPENDAWHGKGFTEWVKVRSAVPLFHGHYQQHIPHSDIGYYLLDSADTFRKQADMMRRAGVSGQVFYHYWFNGRLILEQPAQKLLTTPDIQMPFCFCWANENWTRRWDGNESEILLAQDYSEHDAREFIRYLIPFFRDDRYLRVDSRPLLFVYRPSSIPDVQAYLRVWAEECRANGVPAPYVVAVLTRGAKHPSDFGMDAGVERVLHDWTDGAVPDITKQLDHYDAMNGSVLSYPDVANFYGSQTDTKDFTYFRSIVPIWDNTARYGAQAYVVHGSTPEYFQGWFEQLIDYSKKNLPNDRRFILVNAWNEWAEGAHLEPDSRYGYSYLNSVGRALSNVRYSEQFQRCPSSGEPIRVHLDISEHMSLLLSKHPDFAHRFSRMIDGSSIFKIYDVTVDNVNAALFEGARLGVRQDSDFIVEFRRPALFSASMLERLIQFTSCKPESMAVPNFYGDEALVTPLINGAIEAGDAYNSPIVVYPSKNLKDGFRNIRMCLSAPCFITGINTVAESELPVVTTVIRFHKSGDLSLLAHALGCLVAMQNCVCIPLIAAQDLSPSQTDKLSALLSDFPWYRNRHPIVRHYRSPDGTGDLRSKMLNKSLLEITSRYAAFLDYDDLLMPHAYEWLLKRLAKTDKAVAFGRVYSTSYSSLSGQLLERSRSFEYGFTYLDFVQNNHAPLHSFLLDLEKLDISSLSYFDDQRYMEDYLLTLQLFTRENCDWDSLKLNQYIGDYIHSIDRTHTLAISSDSARQRLLLDSHYILCENRIADARVTFHAAAMEGFRQQQRVLASNTQ